MFNELNDKHKCENILQNILGDIHVYGPVDPQQFEMLAHIKERHLDIFKPFESKLISLMGLFYKSTSAANLIEEIYSLYARAIYDSTGENFTPVQASAYRAIAEKKYFSFSAPTSSGKSFLFRKLIVNAKNDIVIVVPSRALIAEYYAEIIRIVDSSVLVLEFIDNVNTEKTSRRIFIITPERGSELFKRANEFNIELFLLDEAQLSEEPLRGMRFDAFVRRINKVLPHAKKVFAHPFVQNPEAQFKKHSITRNTSSHSYTQFTVGKIFISIDPVSGFEYFSPHEIGAIQELKTDIVEMTLKNKGSLLVYISKQKIYDGLHTTGFQKYLQYCPKLKSAKALATIQKLRDYIGVPADNTEKRSQMIDMMEHGIVIHHGSMPLKARLLIENFIRDGHARICFATSTLVQGINMPFDIVWVDNFKDVADLTLKNLIGRSGRNSPTKNSFDYGYTIVHKRNVSTFCKRYKKVFRLRETSLLDQDLSSIPEDSQDIAEAIKESSYNDDLYLPQSQVIRLSTGETDTDIKFILDNLLAREIPLSGNDYQELPELNRKRIKESFKRIFIQHLRRKSLTPAEQSALSAAIPIMLWRIQGKSFGEIISLRYAYLTRRNERNRLQKSYNNREISAIDFATRTSELIVRYTQIPSLLPNKSLRKVSLYRNTPVSEINFDALIFDTYDYLDKTISLSIVDPLCAALDIYYNKTGDRRAGELKSYIRYGTADVTEIWLLRYGFGFEEIEWLKDYVVSIDSSKIVFRDSIKGLDAEKFEQIKRYL